jgi:hypothetical protein
VHEFSRRRPVTIPRKRPLPLLPTARSVMALRSASRTSARRASPQTTFVFSCGKASKTSTADSAFRDGSRRAASASLLKGEPAALPSATRREACHTERIVTSPSGSVRSDARRAASKLSGEPSTPTRTRTPSGVPCRIDRRPERRLCGLFRPPRPEICRQDHPHPDERYRQFPADSRAGFFGSSAMLAMAGSVVRHARIGGPPDALARRRLDDDLEGSAARGGHHGHRQVDALQRA